MEIYQSIFDIAPDALLVINQEGQITKVNPQCERMFGYGRDELLAQPLEILIPQRFAGIHPSHRSRYQAEPLLRPMGTGLELLGRHKNNSEFTVDIMLSPLETDEERLVLCAVRDVSQRRQASQREEVVRQIREAVWRMAREQDISQVLATLVTHLQGLKIPFSNLGVQLIDDTTDPPSVRFRLYKVETGGWWEGGSGAPPQDAAALEAAQRVVQFWRSGQTAYRPDLHAADPYQERERLARNTPGIRSIIDVPFAQGTLALNSRLPQPFSAEDILLLQSLAGVLSEGFRRLEDLQRLEQRTQEAESLSKAIAVVAGATNLEEVLQVVVQEAARLTSAERTTLFLYDEAEKVLLPRAQVGHNWEVYRQIRLQPGEDLSGQALISGKAALYDHRLNIVDATLRPENQALLIASVQRNPGSGAVVPIKMGDLVIGTLSVRSQHRLCTQKDLVLLERLASQAALAIDRSQNMQRLSESERKLRETQQIGRLGYWEFDFGTQRLTWSEELFMLYERDPALGPPTVEEEASYYTPEQLNELRTYAAQVAATGKSMEFEFDFQPPSGKQRICVSTMHAVENPQGARVGLFGTVQDISERRQAEIAISLQLALQRLRNQTLKMESPGAWQPVMTLLSSELRAWVDFHKYSIQFVDLERGCFSTHHSDDADYYSAARSLPLTAGLRKAVESGTPLYRRSRQEIEYFGEPIEPEVNSVVDVPFRGGTLAMNSLKENAFSERDIQILAQFAETLSEAYQRLQDLSQLEQARQQREEETRVRLAIERAHNQVHQMQSESDWPLFVQVFHQELQGLVPIYWSGFTLIDLRSNSFRVYISTPAGPQQHSLSPVPPSLHRAMETSSPLYRHNRAEMERFEDVALDATINSVVDVRFDHGTAFMNSTREQAFTERDIQILARFAQVVNAAHQRLVHLRLLDQTRQDLLRAQKMEALGQLTAGIAHNFNNLLQANLANISLVRLKGPPEVQGYLDDAEAAAMRGAEMVKQLMLFTRVENGPSSQSTTDLAEVVDNTVRFCHGVIDRSIALRLEVSTGLPLVRGDAHQLEQAVLNLILNARDAFSGIERIAPCITTRIRPLARSAPGKSEVQEYVCVEVQDNGTGMDQETQERIFEPFFTTKETGKGTGLGLATVYGIVQGHGGWVECQSRLGEGTAFLLYLPVAAAEVESPQHVGDSTSVLGGTETLLIIDDEELVRRSTAAVFSNLGYRVLEADNGLHGLELFRQERGKIALVLLDLSMPGLSGREVLRRLREQNPQTKVIVVTGYGADPRKLEGAAGVVGKPFSIAQLAAIIRQAIDS